MTIHIEEIDKVTHSRTITLENLIELFKEHCGAPETAPVLFNYSLGELKRKIEIVWTDDVPKKVHDLSEGGGRFLAESVQYQKSLGLLKEPVGPTQCVTKTVATGELQVGDLVMVRDTEVEVWVGPMIVEQIDPNRNMPYVVGTGAGGGLRWSFARHLTDEDRAQIKRI